MQALHSLWKKFSPTTKLVIGLLVVASWLRLWNIDGSLQFLGDQGRDALVVSRIFSEFDPVFIGPVTSVGNMYLGPLYYYFMLPWLFLSYPSPVGPAIAVGVLGVLSVAAVYYLGKKMVGPTAAAWAAFFLTFSHVVVYYSRFSWNPNPAPLVAMGMMYCTYVAWKKNTWYWLGVAACFSVLIQLHYLTLLSAGGAGVIWLLQLFEVLKTKSFNLKSFLTRTMLAAGIVLISLTPLLLFDWKHNWLNAKGFADIILSTSSDSIAPEGQSIFRVVRETHGRSMHILFEWVIGQARLLNTGLVLFVLGVLGWLLVKGPSKNKSGIVVISAYLLTGIIGTAFYQHSVFDHYIAYLFPVTFLVYGIVLSQLQTISIAKIPVGKLSVLAWTVFFLSLNLPRLPLADANWTIYDMQRVASSITDRVELGEKYNIVLLSETGDLDAQNYRYFLSTTNTPTVKTEQRGEVETLFIIDELNQPSVTDSPVYEIVVFPNKQPSEVYTIEGGPRITVLRKAVSQE